MIVIVTWLESVLLPVFFSVNEKDGLGKEVDCIGIPVKSCQILEELR